jgi:predicted Fe-Mo cluster-binding NifX family protein
MREGKSVRICIPTETGKGIKAKVYGHFGSAPYFTVYDSKKDECEVINNGNQHHEHGACLPTLMLGEMKIDAVICGGMGARALNLLNNEGIKAYRANAETVEQVIKELKSGKIEEFTTEAACTQHSCHG